MMKADAFHRRYSNYSRTVVDAFDKVAADAFETMIAALYYDCGLQAVRDWVSCTLKPIIRTARQAYDDL